MGIHETFPLDESDKLLLKSLAGVIILICLLILILTAGCLGINVEQTKVQALDAISPVIVLKGSTQYEKQFGTPEQSANITANSTGDPAEADPFASMHETPAQTKSTIALPTPEGIPTIPEHYVDPFKEGERWEGQWFEFYRENVSAQKDLYMGIICYRHVYLDRYTWYSAVNGNYYSEYPNPGKRFVAIWIREESFGSNSTLDPGFWYFNQDCFRLQIKGQFIKVDTGHNPVNTIKEFNTQYDYLNTVIAPPFGYLIRYVGNKYASYESGENGSLKRKSNTTAGYVAEEIGWLRMGRGNAIDGYLLFQVPKETQDSDMILVGKFGGFGSAYWRLTNDNGNGYTVKTT